MNYTCNICNYESPDKSNYNKHIKSYKHQQKSDSVVENIQKYQSTEYECEICNRQFTKSYNLQRHKKTCSVEKDQMINDLKAKIIEYQQLMAVKELEMELKSVKNENNLLKEFIKENVKPNKNITYNISVKNYIQKHYPDAPALAGIEDYAKLTFDEETKTQDTDFIGTLVYHYNNNTLHKHLGDFIIKYYKKEDPAQQSIWSSDTSRLTFIVKELLFTEDSIWNHDYKGIKTKNYIVNPILKYIKKYIDRFWMKNIDTFKSLKLNALIKLQTTYQTIYKIKQDIDNDAIGTDIVRYIAPYFSINKNKNLDNNIGFFVDDDIQ